MTLRSGFAPGFLCLMLAACQTASTPSSDPALTSLQSSFANSATAAGEVRPTLSRDSAPTVDVDTGAPATATVDTGPLHVGADGYEPAPVPQDEADEWGPDKGTWQVTLGGSGSNDSSFDAGGFQAQGSAAYYLLKVLNVGVRQGLGFSNSGGPTPSSSWNGQTKIFTQANLALGRFVPYGGANFGWFYGGRGVNDTMAAGLEGGLRWYAKRDAFIFASGEYQWFFNSSSSLTGNFDNGSWLWGLGFGLDF